ncbi:Nucleotide-diphospho-sugar transferase [Musa troglodytarum]|nr:Nucleotide-diphospho-sugar transferase [Musa troglodytarum]
MENKTVILTTLNAAWATPGSIIDLFIESFQIGDGTRKLLDHLVIIALDKQTYVRCLSIHAHCFPLITEGADFSDEKLFMSAGYLSMMWTRIEFLRLVLEKGYNFIFSDVDILWFRNPLPQFYPEDDFQIACDHFMGDAFDLQNIPNGGFNYVKSNNRTIEFYKFWHASREKFPGHHDQDVFNFIKHDPYLLEMGIRVRFLSTAYFGGLCEPSRDFSKVCTMHANCCVGLSRKIHDLRVMLDDWRTYMSLPWKVKRSRAFSWRVPQNCSLAPLGS